MKRLTLLLISFMLFGLLGAQNVAFHEDFEQPSEADSVTAYSSSGTNTWGISTHLAAGGLQSDSAKCSPNDTLTLTTNAFSTTGNSFVRLEFDHIAKIELLDKAIVEVSNDNGATWSKLDSTHYMGPSTKFASLGNNFNVGAYPTDWSQNSPTDTVPENSWWKHEVFNISAIAADTSNVKVRFSLIDGNNGTSLPRDDYAWLLDNIEVAAAPSELVPPEIVMGTPIVQDTITSSNPQTIKAEITDNSSNVDTAFLVYYINGNLADTLGMTNFQADSFQADIPFPGFGRSVTYFVEAIDDAAAQNHGTSNNYSYFMKYNPVVFSEGFNTGTANDKWVSPGWSNPKDWEYEPDETGSSDTGPDGPYEGVGYVHPEASNSDNITMELASPAIDLDSLLKPYMSFYYHMYGADMGDLNVDVYDGSTWHKGVWSISGQQHSSKSAPWTKAKLDISAYKDTATKIRFRAITGNGYKSDMSVDDLKIGGTQTDATDAGIAEITNPAGGVVTNNNFDINVKFQNKGGVNLNKVDINWELDSTSKSTYNWTGTLEPDSLSSEITLGTESVSSGPHNLKVWTTNPNDTIDFNSVNDTMQFTFYGCDNLLSGTYTIGGSNPDYATFSDAVIALNQCGIDGPVTFNVAGGTYDEQISLSDIPGASSTNTITFQSASGDSSDVTLQYGAANSGENHVVKLEGTSYITFKDMTFKSQNNTWPRVFAMNSGAHNISFTNNRFEGVDVTSGGGGTDSALVIVEDSIGNDFTFTHNYLQGGTHGLNISGNGITNVTVNNNEFINQWSTGTSIDGADSPEIKDNLVETNSMNNGFNGIHVANANGAFEIAYNEVYADSTISGYGLRVESSQGDSLNHAQVYNNMATVRGIDGSSTISAGIINIESRFIDYYYNTFHTIGTDELATPLCLYDNTAGETRYLTIKNNIFVNNTEGQIIYTQNIDTAGFDHDYNNYYQTGSNIFGQFNGDDVDDFTSFQSMTGQENNSVQYDPYFADTTDLHVANNFLNNLGTPISGITDDIDGDSRDASNPDMGADEFDASPYDLAVLEVYGPQNSCGLSSSEDITLKVTNIGTSSISSFDASYTLLNDSTTVTETVNTTINSGDTLEYTFSAKVDMDMSSFMKDSTFEFKAWTDHSGDPVPQNDSAATSIESQYQPPAPTASTFSTNYGDSVTITASSQDTLFWYETDTSSNNIATGKYYTTPQLYDTTDYWVEARNTKKLDDTIGNGTLTQSNLPFDGWWDYSWGAMILEASKISGQGIIKSISYHISNSPSNYTMQNQSIYIVHTTDNNFNSTAKPDPANMTQVYQGSITFDGGGWKEIILDTPFNYNGSDNLIIYTENKWGDWQNGYPEFSSTTVTGDKAKYDSDLSSFPTGNGSYNSERPNIRLKGKSFGCPSPRVPVTVNVKGIPTEDAGIVANISPASSIQEGSQQYIDVEVKNFAANPLNSLDISWELDGVHQKTYSWTGNIDYKESDTIRIDTTSFAGGGHDIKLWTSQPNGTADTINSNDTLNTKLTACLHGTYTIGDTTGGNVYDYPSFSDAVDALTDGGICSSVTFQADNGTYNEQLHLTPIAGVDSANTVTFTSMSGDSTDVVLEYDASSSDPHTIKLDSSKYITLSNMTIRGLNNDDAEVVTFEAQSHHNKILNNVIEAAGTGSNAVPVINDQNVGVDYNIIRNNHILNGEQGIVIEGDFGNENMGNVIESNFLENFNEDGLVFEDQDSSFVLNNTLKTNTTYSFSTYGMDLDDAHRVHVINNEVIHTGTSEMTAINLDFCDGESAYPNLIANNFIAITGGSDENKGIHVDGSEVSDIYYNTVNITGGSDQSSALYLEVSSYEGPIRIVNNIFRDSVGYAIVSEDHDGVTQMDHNNYYSESSNFVDWDGTILADLSALQAQTGMDANSLELLPSFVSSTDLHLTDKKFAGQGTPLSVIKTDIDGKTRDTILTTLGAHEVDLLPVDIGIANIINIPSNITEFDSIAPQAVVTNNGTDTITDYAVDYTVDGGTPVTKQITNDTILPYGHTDTIPLDSFVSPAGSYQLCATTVLSTDSNQTNDEDCKDLFGTPVIDGKVTNIDDLVSGCNLTEDSIRITIKNMGIDTISPGFTAKYEVDGNTLVTETVNKQILPNDSITYEFNDPVDLTVTTFDSIFNIAAWVEIPNDNVAYNDTNHVETKSLHTPNTPVVDDVKMGIGADVTLVGDATAPISWFYQDTSTTAFHKGDTLQTNNLYSDTTFWFQAINGQGVLRITEVTQYQGGDGSTSPEPSWLIGSDFVEISNMGVSSMSLDGYTYHSEGEGGVTYDLPDTKLNAGEVLVLAISGASNDDPLNNFYVAADNSVISSDEAGYWITNNKGNIVDAVALNGYSFSSSSGVSSSDWSGNIPSSSGDAGVIRVNLGSNSASDWIISDPTPQTLGEINPDLVNMQIGQACNSPRDSVHVNIVTPDNNAGIVDISTPSGCYLGMEPVTIDIVNLGKDTIDGGLNASFKVDNNSYISPENVTKVVEPFDTVSYTFNTMADLSSVSSGDTSYVVESYVSLTNDTLNYNDTIKSGKINSLYSPQTPVANDTLGTYSDSITLTAKTSNSKDNLVWYENDSTSNQILSGKNFTTPILYDTTTYWVSAKSGCESPRVPLTVNIEVPDDNAALTDITVAEGCNLTANEPVSIDIHNMGTQTIDGNITASYRVNGGSYISPENVNTVINPGDTGTYTFNTTVDMVAPQGDTTFVIDAYVSLAGDTFPNNDSLTTDTIESNFTPDPPVVNDTTVDYASITDITANSPYTVKWYETQTSPKELDTGNVFTTPILYDTTTYWVSARQGKGDLKFTEITHYQGFGDGSTDPEPSWLDGDDFVEITNLGSAPISLNGYTYHSEGQGGATYDLPDISLDAGEVLTLAIYGANNGDPANNFYIAADNQVSSMDEAGYWLTNDGGDIVDAVALNGYSFSSASGVSSSDWSGNIPSSSGDAGVIRINSDNNTASDWIISDPTPQTLGAINPQIDPGSLGSGCESPRVAITVNTINHPKKDVQLVDIMEPSTGQLKTANEPVKFRIKNNGTDSLFNITAGYEFDGQNPIVENLNVNMGSGDTLIHTFSSTVDMLDFKGYPVTGYVNNPNDTVSINDTLVKAVKNKLDYCESRATSNDDNFIENVSVNNMDNNSTGAAKYTDFSFSVQPPVIYPGEKHQMEIEWGNASSYYSDVAVKVFIDVNRDGIFNEATETFFVDSSATENDTIFTDSISIPSGTAAGKAAMRVVLERTDNSSDVTPCQTYEYGETEDYLIQVTPFMNTDAGVVNITEPGSFVFNQNQQFNVVVRNFGSNDINGLDVNYSIGNTSGSHTFSGTIASQSIDTMAMPNLNIPAGNNVVCAHTSHSADSNTFNDYHCTNVYRQYTTNPPYYDNFEGDNYFMQDTSQIKQTEWELGYPLGNNIMGPHSGQNAWMVDLDSNYANSTQDILYTPRFAITNVGVDSLIFWHHMDVEQGADGGNLEYLTSNGNWKTLGKVNDSTAQNWYTDTILGKPSFTGNSNGWMRSAICIDSTHLPDISNITQFRFVFFSDGSNHEGDGWAIDDFEITLPKVDTDAGVNMVMNPVSSTTTGDSVTVEVEVKNYGFNNQTGFPVTYQINNNTPVTENWSGNLSTDQTDSYTFNTEYMAPADDYTLTTYTELANDGNHYNDTVSYTVTSDSADKDVGIVDMKAMQNAYNDTTSYGKDVSVKVWIHNFGKQTIKSMDLEYEQNNNTPVTETWNGNLAGGDTVEYTFNQTYNVGVIGEYDVCSRTLLSGDAYAPNDEYCEKWVATGLESSELAGFVLHQNIPNPAVEETSIDFEVPYGGKAQFEVVDMFGRKLYTDELSVVAGRHTIDLDTKGWGAGVYYYSITFDGHEMVRKMVVTK